MLIQAETQAAAVARISAILFPLSVFCLLSKSPHKNCQNWSILSVI